MALKPVWLRRKTTCREGEIRADRFQSSCLKTYAPKGQAIMLQSRKAARSKKEQKGKRSVGEPGPVLGARF